MGYIFISYSHKDTAYAHRLARALQKRGLEVWIDERLDYGSQWPHEIQKQLDNCDAFIVLMSPRSFASEWVQSELQRAKRKLKPVFPLLLEGEEPWLSVESTQFYDVRRGNLPDEKFFSTITRVVSSRTPETGLSASGPVDLPDAKKSGLKIGYLLAIAGVLAVVLVAVILPLFDTNPPGELPTPTDPPPSPGPTTDAALVPEEPTEVTAQATEPPSVTDSEDYMDGYGVPMRFVPASEFQMGSSASASPEERPAHTVYLDDYYIDTYEVTNERYKSCVDAGVCQPPQGTGSVTRSEYYGSPEFDDFPVVYVDWDMAVAYCEWRGAHLPSEAQWEKAARGTDGRSYPWGEGIDSSLANYNYTAGETTQVGAYQDGQSPYGVFDMAGNVWEWVADWYDPDYYKTLGDVTNNPTGPSSGQFHVLRGGSWINEEDFVRTFTRGWNELEYFGEYTDFGFRCARRSAPAALSFNSRNRYNLDVSTLTRNPRTWPIFSCASHPLF